MDALTPARRALRTGRFPQGNPAHERPPDLRTGLSASWVRPSDHSASNHLIAPPIAPARYPSASTASSKSRSGLRHKRAGSPDNPAESSSLTLRTGRSPPVASHPSSRRRSYFQLQDGERIPEEDSHLSDQTHSQTHPLVASPPRLSSNRGQCACERIELARWKSSSEFGLNSVTESHCVAVRRGGEQLEVNDQSVTK